MSPNVGRACRPVALLILLVLAPCAESAAQSPTRRAIQLFREARIHYNMGHYALAADKLNAAIKANPSIPGPHRNLGLTYRALGQCDLALPHFRRYLQLSPRGRHVPRVRKEIAYCAAKVGEQGAGALPLGSAQIVIRGGKRGAQVIIDGVARGSLPTGALPVQAGRRVVTIHHSGFLPWTGVVEVAKGQVAAVTVKLKPDPAAAAPDPRPTSLPSGPPGSLKILGLPRRAVVAVDGAQVVVSADGELKVAAGDRQLEITRAGLKPWAQTVTVRGGKTTTIMPMMEQTRATRSVRRWAWITAAAAAALGIAGAAVGLAENDTYNDIRSYDRTNGTRAGMEELTNRRDSLGLTANLLYGFSAAALGTSVILFILTPEETRHDRGSMVAGR